MRRLPLLLATALIAVALAATYGLLAQADEPSPPVPSPEGSPSASTPAAALSSSGTAAAASPAGPVPVVPALGPERVHRVAPALAPGVGEIELRARPGTRRTIERADPAGGLPWQLRTFTADRVVPRNSRRPGVDPRIGSTRCAQLGRLRGGRFGWIDQDGSWRPVGSGFLQAPLRCVSGSAPKLAVVRLSIFGYPATRRDQARIRRSVVFAIGPAKLPLVARRGGRVLSHGTGALLALEAPSMRPSGVTVRAVPARATPSIDRTGPPVDPANLRVIARAADPAGGLPLAALRKGDQRLRGGESVAIVCFGTALRAIGTRVGIVDFRLGTFNESLEGGSYGCGGAGPMLPDRPVGTASQIGGSPVPGETDDTAARINRRTLPGRTILTGLVDPSVRSLTITSPQDTRTLRFDGTQPGYMVVYAGTFTTGEFVLRSTLTSGRVVEQRIGAGS